MLPALRDRRSVVPSIYSAPASFILNFKASLPDLGAELVQPYKLDDARSDRQLELKHADLQKAWNMDRVSNAPFPEVKLAFPWTSCHLTVVFMCIRTSLGVFVGISRVNK